MGRMALDGMLDGMLEAGADFKVILGWHLSSNHFPPIPEVYDAAVESIEAGNDEDYDRLIELPDGVTWRDNESAPAWACIEGWHLDGFISWPEEEA